MIPFITLTDTRGQKISDNAEIVQFVKAADNAHDAGGSDPAFERGVKGRF